MEKKNTRGQTLISEWLIYENAMVNEVVNLGLARLEKMTERCPKFLSN